MSVAGLVCALGIPGAAYGESGSTLMPSFAPYRSYTTGSAPAAVATGDLNGDGRTDIVMTTGHLFGSDEPSVNDNELFVFMQQPGGSLLAQRYPTAVDGWSVAPVAIADLNEDGRPDIAVETRSGAQVFYQQDGSFAAGKLAASTPTGTSEIVARDMNRDGLTDLVLGGYSDLYLATQRPDGAGFDTRQIGPYLERIAVGDLNGDGLPDVAATSSGTLRVLLQQSDGSFNDTPVSTSGYITDLAIADMTGDGREDVIALNGPNGAPASVDVYAQSAGGRITPVHSSYPTAGVPAVVATGDLNGDHRADVALLHDSGYPQAGAYLQLPGGGLSYEGLAPIPGHESLPGSLAIGDVDSDGRPDLVFAKYDSDPGGLITLPQAAPAPVGGSSAPAARPILIVSGGAGRSSAQATTRALAGAGRFERYVAPRRDCRGASARALRPARFERLLGCLVRYARRRAGVRALRRNRRLDTAAQMKLADIQRCGEFRHDACGRSWSDVFKRAGYRVRGHGYVVGENLAYAPKSLASPRGILRLWLESPAHRHNLLGTHWRDQGLAVAAGHLHGLPVILSAQELGTILR